MLGEVLVILYITPLRGDHGVLDQVSMVHFQDRSLVEYASYGSETWGPIGVSTVIKSRSHP